jgi:hypothetical protein
VNFFSFLNIAFVNILHKCAVYSELDSFTWNEKHEERALDVLHK